MILSQSDSIIETVLNLQLNQLEFDYQLQLHIFFHTRNTIIGISGRVTKSKVKPVYKIPVFLK